MSIKAINATTQQLSKSLKKSMGKKPMAVVRAYMENPQVFKNGNLSKKAITAELCDRFATTKKAAIVDEKLLGEYNLPTDAKLKDLSKAMVSKYLKTWSENKKYDGTIIFLTKEAYGEWLKDIAKDLKVLKKQTSNGLKKACEQIISKSKRF